MKVKWDELNEFDRDELIIKTLKLDLHFSDGLGHWVYFENDQDATLFRPSQNIADAWEVVEKLRIEFEHVEVRGNFGRIANNYCCEVGYAPEWEYGIFGYADRAPEAICKAALKAYNIDIE